MKKAILLLALSLLIKVSYSQTNEEAIVYISSQLEKSHDEFRTGVFLSVGGALVTAAAVGLKDKDNQQALLIGGAFFSLAGAILMIDSHKFIGRAGRVKLKANGLVIEL